jgi:hypothetical protein
MSRRNSCWGKDVYLIVLFIYPSSPGGRQGSQKQKISRTKRVEEGREELFYFLVAMSSVFGVD